VASRRDEFARNVFINCPFDSEYLQLLRPLLFTILEVGFVPRIASERSDSGENRVDKIAVLISQCQYSIHDLSRLRASDAGEFYRMNMPFELGIEYGSRLFGLARLRQKRCLVLEKDQHDFQRAISDLAGIDIKRHRNEPAEIVRAVRDVRCVTGSSKPLAFAVFPAPPGFGIGLQTLLRTSMTPAWPMDSRTRI
jgi:hypothetical protein